SACGRPLEALHAELFDGARIVVFSADRATPHAAAALLVSRGFGESRMTVLEHLGGERERIRRLRVRDWPAEAQFADLNLVAIECAAGEGARVLSRAPGLPDDAYAHDGQITKREVRAATLARLSPRPGELLWDIGAGSGSIGIEWMRAAPRARAVGIELRADRATRARENAAALGVPGYHVVEGRAPEALAGLDAPDAIFVGGGLTSPDLLQACWITLKPGGRLVANAVTLESEALLPRAFAERGGDLVRLAVARAEPVGGYTGWRPLMPVTQWAVEKPRSVP
ncbi:MAG: precorrin-6Y C5,15-methyltransferase (decarboxylating) subunit CbiT, partial [Pseudomonadota bacterium]|nr:precorrin-6Y C5,15-methyltransferase (decarboxylating) subunit CbiT [Pseudomonadota bacterium]